MISRLALLARTAAMAFFLCLTANLASAQLIDAQMKPGDQFTGDIESVDDIDLVQIETVAGSSFKVIVSPLKGSSLLPSVRLIDASDDSVLAEAAATKKKVVLKTPAVPNTGVYLLRITGTAGSTGGYLLKYTEKLAKEAKKIKLDTDVDGGADLSITFDAADGFVLTVTVLKKGGKSAADPAEPVLTDPDDAVVVVPPELLKTNKKGSKFTLKKVPLSSTGSYTLTTLNEGDTGSMRARAKLRRGKPQKRKLVELPIGETGEPTLTGRVLATGASQGQTPLPGVTVRVQSQQQLLIGEDAISVRTDADGLFVLPSPPEGDVFVTLDGTTQTLSNVFPVFRLAMTVDRDGPSELPAPMILTQQSQGNTGFASNVDVGPGGVTTETMDGIGNNLPSMSFHGGIGTIVREDGELFAMPNVSPRINRVPAQHLSVPLLDGGGLPLDAAFYVNIEPANLSFDTSGAAEGLPQGLDLSMPNDRGFAPGTNLDIWAWDPTDAAWVNRTTQTGVFGTVNLAGDAIVANDVVLEGGIYTAAAPINASCATTLTGHVQDATTGAPLIGVHVATSLGVFGLTDVNGDFSLALVPAYDPALGACLGLGFSVVVTSPTSTGSVRDGVDVPALSTQPGGTTDIGIIELALPSTGTVVCELTDNGIPIIGESISLSGPTSLELLTDDWGRAFVAGLAPGSYVGSFTFIGAEQPTEVAFSVSEREITSIAIQRAGGQGDRDVSVRVVRVPDSSTEPPEPLSGVTVVLVGSDPFSSEGLTAITNAQGRASFTSVDPPYDVTATDDQPYGLDGTARVTTSVLGIDPGDDSIGVPVSVPRAPGDDTTDATLSGSIANIPEGTSISYLVEAISADPDFSFRTTEEAFFDGEFELSVPSGHSWHVVMREHVLEFAFPDDIEYVAGVLFELDVADPGPEGTTTVDFDLNDPAYLPFDQVVALSYANLPTSLQLTELTLAYLISSADPALDALPLLEQLDEVFGDDTYVPPTSLRLPNPAHPSLAGFSQSVRLSSLAAELTLVAEGERHNTCALPYDDAAVVLAFDMPASPVISNPSSGEVFEISELPGLPLAWFDQTSGPDRGWASATLRSDDVFLSLGVELAVWQVFVPLGAGQAVLPPSASAALGTGAWNMTLDVTVLAGSSFDFDDGFGDTVDVNLAAARAAADAECRASVGTEFEIVPD